MAIELVDALTSLATIEVTTGASPVDITLKDPTVQTVFVKITSGGTAGEEVINLPYPTLDIDESYNVDYVAAQYIFTFVGQTDPSDTIKIQQGGFDGFGNLGTAGDLISKNASASKVSLTFPGATATLVWAAAEWLLNYPLSDGNVDVEWSPSAVTVATINGTSDTAPQTLTLLSGNAASGTNHNGGSVNIILGAKDGSGTPGQFGISNLPTADPHISNKWWNDAGTVKISAG